MTDSKNGDQPSYYETVDVSQPRPPRKEIDIIKEQIKLGRKIWIRKHKVRIYAALGIVIVALIILFIRFYYEGTNPMSRFNSSLAKDFGTSFDFTVDMSKNDEDVMSYKGSASFDRSKRRIEALYDATYTGYFYKSALYTDSAKSMRGSYFNGKWTVSDVSEKVMNYFDFDTDYRSGGFDAGALLRFTELTTVYSSIQLDKSVKLLRERLSTNSSIATITSHSTDDGTTYDYDIDLSAVMKMICDEGAPLFYRSTDYDVFKARYLANLDNIRDSEMTMSFTVDNRGYMSALEMSITTGSDEYRLSCKMSNFGESTVEIPDEFFKTAQMTAPQK